MGLWMTFSSRFPIGTNIYESDWDLLIILDACRADAMSAVVNESQFISNVDYIYSLGSTSSEWLLQTFSESHRSEIRRTAYITDNPFAHRIFVDGQRPPSTETASADLPVPISSPKWTVVDKSDFGLFEFVWSSMEGDNPRSPPRPITDRAVQIGREKEFDRMIVHYMQPHSPYIAENIPDEVSDEGESPHVKLRKGKLSRNVVWEGYLDNLRYILQEVKLLLRNIDADKVVLTSDHGEGFGEFGSYGHTFGWLHPVVRKVPWVETEARDTNTYTPEVTTQTQNEVDIEAHLRNLGYIN